MAGLRCKRIDTPVRIGLAFVAGFMQLTHGHGIAVELAIGQIANANRSG